MRILSRTGLRLILILACAFAARAFAAEPPTIEDFFRLPQYSEMRISPDGKWIAALVPFKGRQNLAVMDVATHKATAITTMDERDVVWFDWLGSSRLLLGLGLRGTRQDDLQQGEMYAIDRDGGDIRQLVHSDDTIASVGHALRVVALLPGETTDFIGQEIAFDHFGPHPGALVRIDSRTGRRTQIALGKPASAENESWVVDRKGVARAMIASGKGTTRIFYRAGEDAPWQKLDEFSTISPGWEPLAVADDDRTLIVAAYHGEDKAAIMRYDPAKHAFGEVMARHPQVDIERTVRDEGRIVGVRYQADRGGTAMFDEDLARVQKGVDNAFPDAVNVLSWSRDRKRFVVFSYSDVSPGSFYYFDATTGKMQWIADVAPWIKPKQMAHRKAVRYAARDGLEIPAYLTLPKDSGGKDLPLVMVIHGGPWVNGDGWYFDPEAEFLASRGYAVLQPNYRGTRHYGWKHFASSFGQWGLTMEEDIEDGVHWAVKQGIADPKRVAIYGASYGGYATMMGLAKTPDLYRCGINYVGVTDIPFFLNVSWSDYAYSSWIDYDAVKMVGDTDRDAKRLAETSPVNLAARIKVPVLMAYGTADRRVPIEHGLRMKAALDRAGVKYEWMAMEGEGHGFRTLANQEAFYGAMEKFLAKNMK